MANDAILNPPIRFADTKAPLGYAYRIAETQMLETMTDKLRVSQLGIASLVGDVVASGSDVVRVTEWGSDVGFNLPMTALANETDTVTDSPVTVGYEEITLGQYGVGHSETYKNQGMSRPEGVTLDRLISKVPDSIEATFRRQVCIVGASFATAVGSSSTPLSVDDWLDLLTAYQTNLGAGQPKSMLHQIQMDQLRRSFRNEPAMQGSSADFAAFQGLRVENGIVSQLYPNYAGLGIDIAVTEAVTTSTGAYQGFAHSAGGIGWVRMSTAGLRTANPQGTMLIPEFGTVIEELTDGAAQTKRRYRATSWLGFDAGSADVFLQRRVISVAA